MKYNHAMLALLFNSVSSKLADAAAYHMRRATACESVRRHLYMVSVFDDIIEVTPDPVFVADMPRPESYFVVHFYDCVKNEVGNTGVSALVVSVPLTLLAEKPRKYFIYRISFKDCKGSVIDNSNPLRAGYLGITKRNPFTRFKEHQSAARNGEGHLLHKTWRGLIRAGANGTVAFDIMDHYKTIDEAYGAEERLVDDMTLAPKGLNAIPGGMKGIRMMHQLRLLNGTHQVSVADRDAALVRLENQHHDRNSPCAHYRTGHFRNLPSGKMTWVSPCWVNPAVV